MDIDNLYDVEQFREAIMESFPEGPARDLWLKWLAGVEARLSDKSVPSKALH